MSKNKSVIKVGADVKEAKDGIQQIVKQLNILTKAANKSSFKKLSESLNSLSSTVSFVTSAVNTVKDAVNETIEAYNKQAQAEIQLEAAARNNPYLNAANVKKSVLSRGPLSVSVAELVVVYFAPAS